MSDYSELKKLAEDALTFAGMHGETSYAEELFGLSANPGTVLALIAEFESLRKDAERYRWIKDPRRRSIEFDSAFDEFGVPIDSVIDGAISSPENPS